jgi:cellular nucleic acid-binding protein
MVFIYALQLEQGKYYIGKTNNPQIRLESHFNSNGSEWTKIYKPLKVIELIPNCDDYDEDKITRQYMDKYGINNVRGGSFVSVKLEKSTIDILKQMSNGTNNKCFVCGKNGHFAKDCEDDVCWETKSEEDYEEVWVCEYCGKEFMKEQSCEYHEKYCSLKNKKQIVYENDYDDSDGDGDGDDSYSDSDGEYDDVDDVNCCFRCGREGHYAPSCYASKHINGYYLKK